jgi:hypothetical protein
MRRTEHTGFDLEAGAGARVHPGADATHEAIAMAMWLEQQKLLERLLAWLEGAGEVAHGGIELQARVDQT